MTGGAELVLFSLLHLVAVHGIAIDESKVQVVNNTEYTPTLHNWPDIYRYRGVPNATHYYVISSPGFPNSCCNISDTTITATVKAGKREHLFLICTDLDVPDHSHLRFWTGSNTFVPKGRNTRTISWLPRGYLRVDFIPPPGLLTETYTGFRCMVWETDREVGLDEWLPMPSSDCQVIDTSQPSGGHVSVGIWPAQLSVDFFYDCTWQLKVPNLPESTEEWGVFVYITKMNVDGLVEIRDGLASTSRLLATNRNDPPPNHRSLDSLKQPSEGFVSKKGLFVKLIKHYYDGEFAFTYGSFALPSTPSSAPLRDYAVLNDERMCTLHMNSSYSMRGFLCNSTQRCIPVRYACDEVAHCIDASDEGDFCSESFFYDTWFKDCQAGQRACKNGICVIASVRCPEDPCPEDRPHKCDSDYTCFGPNQMCDGVNFCTDGADEDCSQNYDFSHIYPILGAICGACAVLIIVCVVLWFWRRKRLRRGGNVDSEGVTSPGSDLPMNGIRRGSIEQEALITEDGIPTPPNGYEDDEVNHEGADHDSTTTLTRDYN